MKKYILFFCFISIHSFAQEPSINWQKNIGGSGNDVNLISTQNFQGDIFIAGNSNSNNQDIPGNQGGTDIYVAKLTDLGTQVWSKNFGGTLDDIAASIASTTDGGLIILCYTASSTNDFLQAGVWLLKLSSDGTEDFKTFYGANVGQKGKVIQTSDGGYIFNSSKTENASDFWVVKTDAAGAITWQNTYGGISNDYAVDILEYDNHYYLLGDSESTSVNRKTNHGGFDILFLKIDLTGLVIWTKLFGGPSDDGGNRVVLDEFNNLMLLGSNSALGDDVNSNNGAVDLWLLRLGTDGVLSSNSSTGGLLNDYPKDLYFNESNFMAIIVSETFSDWLPPEETEPVTSNILVAELTPFGGEQWKLILGGGSFDNPTSIIGTIDGGFLISGHSFSNDGNLTGNKGGADFWLVKLGYPCPGELNLDAATFTKSVSRTAKNFISTNSKFEGTHSHVKLKSNYLLLEPGFKVDSGTVFETQIGGCN